MTNYFPDPEATKNEGSLETLDTHKQMVNALGVKNVYVDQADVKNLEEVLSDESGAVNTNQMHEALMKLENRYRTLNGKDELKSTEWITAPEDIVLSSPESKPHDPVHHPHYYDTPGGRETKEIIRDLLGPEGYKAWAVGNSIKYLSRYDRKENAIQDLRKSIEYIQMVITEIADN